MENAGEAHTGRILADVRLRVQIIPEKGLVRSEYLLKCSLFVFMLIDVGKNDPVRNGDDRLSCMGYIFGYQLAIELQDRMMKWARMSCTGSGRCYRKRIGFGG
jgi:hypothetical protein